MKPPRRKAPSWLYAGYPANAPLMAFTAPLIAT
jgi:hypothetical protein